MPDAVAGDLIDRYGEDELIQLADRDGDGDWDAAVVDRALVDASELMDGYLARRYQLPLSEVEPMLVGLACDIARYRLQTINPLEVVTENYRQALKALRDIADGRVRLSVGGAEPEAGGGTVLVDGPDRVFTRDTLRGF